MSVGRTLPSADAYGMMPIMRSPIMMFAWTVCFLAAGCGTNTGDSTPISANQGEVSSRPTYQEYTTGVEQGGPLILFFARKDEPLSERTDAAIRSLFHSDAPAVSVYRVPMPADPRLMMAYGVFVENTVVLVDHGRRVAQIVHPSSEELRSFLMHVDGQ